MNNLVAIVATEAKRDAEGIEDLEERAKACMKAAHGHWMVTNEDEQFSGAIAALMMLSSDEEKERIEYAVKISRALNAATSGIPVNFDELFDTEIEPLPLVKW